MMRSAATLSTTISVSRACEVIGVPRSSFYRAQQDEEVYLCHWRTMYRILEAHQEVEECRNQRRHPPAPKPQVETTGPRQLWS